MKKDPIECFPIPLGTYVITLVIAYVAFFNTIGKDKIAALLFPTAWLLLMCIFIVLEIISQYELRNLNKATLQKATLQLVVSMGLLSPMLLIVYSQ